MRSTNIVGIWDCDNRRENYSGKVGQEGIQKCKEEEKDQLF